MAAAPPRRRPPPHAPQNRRGRATNPQSRCKTAALELRQAGILERHRHKPQGHLSTLTLAFLNLAAAMFPGTVT